MLESKPSVFVEHPSRSNFITRIVLIIIWSGTVFMAGIGWNSRINANLAEMYDSISYMVKDNE